MLKNKSNNKKSKLVAEIYVIFEVAVVETVVIVVIVVVIVKETVLTKLNIKMSSL